AASRFVGIDGYADGIPGFYSLSAEMPDQGLFALDPAADVVLVLIGADEGIGVWNDRGSGLMRPGESFRLGQPFFDSHPVWHLPVAEAGKTYSLELKLH